LLEISRIKLLFAIIDDMIIKLIISVSMNYFEKQLLIFLLHESIGDAKVFKKNLIFRSKVFGYKVLINEIIGFLCAFLRDKNYFLRAFFLFSNN
jgi:hypothetical protein